MTNYFNVTYIYTTKCETSILSPRWPSVVQMAEIFLHCYSSTMYYIIDNVATYPFIGLSNMDHFFLVQNRTTSMQPALADIKIESQCELGGFEWKKIDNEFNQYSLWMCYLGLNFEIWGIKFAKRFLGAPKSHMSDSGYTKNVIKPNTFLLSTTFKWLVVKKIASSEN